MTDKLIAVPESMLTGIGDAIRAKRDIVTPIPIADMAMQIGLIGGGIPSNFGLSKMWMGTITVDTPIILPTIVHGLEEVPKLFMMWLDSVWDASIAPGEQNYVFSLFVFNPSQDAQNEIMTAGKLINNSGSTNLKWRNTYDGKIKISTDRIILANNSTSIFRGKYNIIAMA